MRMLRGIKRPRAAIMDRPAMRRMMRITRKILVDVLVIVLLHFVCIPYRIAFPGAGRPAGPLARSGLMF